MPYRLIPGPLLKLAEVGGGAAAAVAGGASAGAGTGAAVGAGSGAGAGAGGQEERRRFLVLYEIVASEGSDRPPPKSRGEREREPISGARGGDYLRECCGCFARKSGGDADVLFVPERGGALSRERPHVL